MAENDREPTERVVLRLAKPGTVTVGDGPKETWEVIGTTDAATKSQAIKALAKGEPGKYRSVPLRSWQGGVEIVLPEKPKPESRLFE